MTVRKVWLGSVGPYQYDDVDLINDRDGDLSGETFAGISTTGQMHVSQNATLPDHVARFSQVQTSIANTHVQNSDTSLAFGTANQVTASELRSFLNGIVVTDITIVANGFSPSVNVTARAMKIGRLVSLTLPDITGTSNATVLSINIPVGYRPSDPAFIPVRTTNNAVNAIGFLVLVAGAATNHFYPNVDIVFNSWSATGTKTIFRSTFTYLTT